MQPVADGGSAGWKVVSRREDVAERQLRRGQCGMVGRRGREAFCFCGLRTGIPLPPPGLSRCSTHVCLCAERIRFSRGNACEGQRRAFILCCLENLRRTTGVTRPPPPDVPRLHTTGNHTHSANFKVFTETYMLPRYDYI